MLNVSLSLLSALLCPSTTHTTHPRIFKTVLGPSGASGQESSAEAAMDSLDNMTTSPYIQTLYSENMTHDNIDPLNVTSEPVSQEFYEIMFVHFQMMIEGLKHSS